ncbi:MAG: hypothetical protein GX139_09895 [Armatimonadetes bacterium]|nr:hypothetical protein [Armatimonadota bacterium]
MGYFYLGLSTALITMWALCYKLAIKYRCELTSVNTWVYVGATLITIVYFFATDYKWSTAAALFGFATGLSCYLSTLAFFYHIRTGVLAVSWTVIGLAVGFPVAASIFIWGENPTTRQMIGLALIPLAFILCNPGSEKKGAQ